MKVRATGDRKLKLKQKDFPSFYPCFKVNM